MNMSGMSGMGGTGSMSDGMMMMGGVMQDGVCSIQMLGNWRTVGACFLTYSWHISTEAQFAGSCIGVFLIVVLIEMVRRMGREYDRYVASQAFANIRRLNSNKTVQTDNASTSSVRRSYEDQERNITSVGKETLPAATATTNNVNNLQVFFGNSSRLNKQTKLKPAQFHPTFIQQSIRSIIYGIQFAGAYLIMLIAMSFNGYILISIVLGGIVGHFVSTWDAFPFQSNDLINDYDDSQLMGLATTPAHPVGVLPQQYNSTAGACCN